MSNLKESGVVFETGSIKSFFLRKKGRSRSLVQNSIILYEWSLKEERKTQGFKENKKVI